MSAFGKVVRILMIMGLMLLLAVMGLLIYLKVAYPKIAEAKTITIHETPEMLKRGKYLAHSVAVCMDCHSTRDWSKFSGPLVKGTLGKGGEKFRREFGFPGEYYANNITPAGISDWTDGEVFRAITTGVDKDNNALFPIMPHHNYGKMDENDIKAIIVYIRSLAPIENEVPESSSDFPMNFIINTIPKEANFSPIPDKLDKVAYGEYILTMAGCNDCHTKQVKGKAVKGMELAGGFEFNMGPAGIAYSANITPDKSTGIGNWTEKQFVSKFKEFTKTPHNVEPGMQQSPMPWTMYAGMEKDDLEAIFAYLQTVKPIENKVVVFKKAQPE